MKIDFVDFWFNFNKKDNYFYKILINMGVDVEIDTINPEILFFSVFGNINKLPMYKNTKKVFYTGENIDIKQYTADYFLSFDETTAVNLYLPHFLLYPNFYELVNKPEFKESDIIDRKFCNFIYSNNIEYRNKYFSNLSKYKKIDSGGRCMNNLGYIVENKRVFCKDYKFTIAIENGLYRPNYYGYVTEKIIDAMVANSIPIYNGGDKVKELFNYNSFINIDKYSLDISEVVELDKNINKYLDKLNQPWFMENKIPEILTEEYIINFFKRIING